MNYKQLSFYDIPGLKDLFSHFGIEIEVDETPTRGDSDLSNDELERCLTTVDRDICLEEIEHILAHNILDFLDDPEQLLQAVHAYARFKEVNT